jgi:hypothetical protein
LLADSHHGDVRLIEQVDRLSRLKLEDWQNLKAELAARKVRVVALDVPTSWMMAVKTVDDFTARMFSAINDMMLDMLAAIARKDYEDRRRRQMQGQAKAKAEGKYVGRPENKRRNNRIAAMLAAGTSYSAVQEATGLQPRDGRQDRQTRSWTRAGPSPPPNGRRRLSAAYRRACWRRSWSGSLPVYQIYHIAKFAKARDGLAAEIGTFIVFVPLIAVLSVLWGFLWFATLWAIWQFFARWPVDVIGADTGRPRRDQSFRS